LIVPGGNDLVLRNPPPATRQFFPTQHIDKRIANNQQTHPQQASGYLRSYIRTITIIESHSKQKRGN